MRKVLLIFSVLALTSCKFDENGNKMVIPEDQHHSEMEHSADMHGEHDKTSQGNYEEPLTNEIKLENHHDNDKDTIDTKDITEMHHDVENDNIDIEPTQ